ncbi:hypothetical protein [Streptomyces sp. NPDC048659]|uniref:hypothetical protein n=1 Tax=Streptomyces sp. NPDC048659 TaxID=3155489 RepID=UPI00343C004F
MADAYWGPGGDRVTVVGRERHTRRWIVIDMATRHLYGFRPKLVHTPRVLERLREAGHGRGLGEEYAADVSVTLERYARGYRADTSPYSPHPDRCLCHACLTGEAEWDRSPSEPGGLEP